MKSAAKKRSRCQSTSFSTPCVSRRASTITSAAPAIAVHARFRPAKKPPKIDTNTTQTSANKPRSSFWGRIVGPINRCHAQHFSKTKTQNEKIDCQPNSGRRQERPRKFRKGDVREVSNDHILRIPDQRGHTANICAGRERNEVWQKGQLAAPDNSHDERGEHQANCVVH